MQPALLLSFAVALVAGTPAATPEEECTPRTKCIDGINACGVRYGACYDVCKPESSPIAPLCVSTTASTSARTSVTVTTTTTTTATPTLIRTSACPSGREGSGYTVCWDGVNECGQMYGGCFADCKPWPTFAKPPCRTTVLTMTVPTPTPTLMSA